MRKTLFLLPFLLPLAAAAQDARRPALGDWGVDMTAMDRTVKPGDDFFSYVNGNWLKTAVIPADRTRSGAFDTLQIQSEDRLKALLEELRGRTDLSPEERRLRDFYTSYLDQAGIDARGLAPARGDLDRIDAIRTHADVSRIVGTPEIGGGLFDIGIDKDAKNPSRYAVFLVQSGLLLPDRDYYLNNDDTMVKLRAAYRAYIARMFTLAGFKDADARADRVLALETAIAGAQWTRAERRDQDKIYNPMTVAELKTFAPQFDWDAFLSANHIASDAPDGAARRVIVMEKTAFPKLAAIFAQTPVSTWRDFITAHYLHNYASVLPHAFYDADFDFFGKTLTGREVQQKRDTRAVHAVDIAMGEALGKLYVARWFPPTAKAKAQELVHNLLESYRIDIARIDWMTPETKKRALEKLALFNSKIGYPDRWRDYAALEVSPDNALANRQNGALFEWRRQVTRLDSPVVRDEWGLTPPTINAYYEPSLNEIVFPAAILQPPFFDPNADDAVNYGGIGAVIGHEISHGFDDQGSKYDGKGVLDNWWAESDRKAFDARTAALTAQYDSYEPLPGLHVIGVNTLGENIADLAGLSIALKAYHLSLKGKPAPVIDGLTGDQRFFLSYGQIWRNKYRDGAMRALVMGDEHSPSQFRVIGTTRNLDEWYDAFGVTPDQHYYVAPEKRVRLW